ncbi:CpsD/CapB family tyrosine-protein kinase [Loktanella agnita]|uniref:CpsD/CapB family tyrosine-protein kinase n=1 Tax=Loktanella agnita TaxID=287097 RepID=UPI003986C557
MERTQNAIKKARGQRSTKKRAHISPNSEASDDAWRALRRFTPAAAQLKHARIITSGLDPAQVSVDILRTRLLQQMRRSGWTKLMVTSAGSGCGKSTTCVNLAISIARQPEMRTILLDFDLRAPSLANIFGYRSAIGTASVLEGRKSFADHAVCIGSNLAVCMGTEISQSPAESLLNRRTHDLIAQIEETYAPDLMIFDMPPIYSNDDTAALAPAVDCALAIVAAEETKMSEIDSCERDLAAITNVAGLVVNKCRFPELGQGSTDPSY